MYVFRSLLISAWRIDVHVEHTSRDVAMCAGAPANQRNPQPPFSHPYALMHLLCFTFHLHIITFLSPCFMLVSYVLLGEVMNSAARSLLKI